VDAKRLIQRAGKLSQLLTDPVYRRGLRLGVAASVEHRALGFPAGIRTVLDVGANRGQFALFTRRRYPDAMIYCFEPLASPRRKLEALFAADAAVQAMPYALGAASGAATLHETRDDDSSSLMTATDVQTRNFPGSREVASVPIAVRTLDAVAADLALVPPVLLKIDVQGAELDVLRGAVSTLPALDYAFIECSFVELYAGQALIDDVLEFLRERGFRTVGTGVPTYGHGGQALQIDVLLERASSRP
jgi:FkbM family methyltransferase